MPDNSEWVRTAAQFRQKLQQVKRSLEPRPYAWYPYDSLTNVSTLAKLLDTTDFDFPTLTGSGTVLDVGTADGELAFFLEHRGINVLAVDNPATNVNEMHAVRDLKAALRAEVEFREIDLDRDFVLPEGRFGLVLLLGILYHLKNPYWILERLATISDYCLLSTRVARFLPDGVTRIADAPVAYLVEEDELNSDATNYWIFTEAGLRRMVSRAGWSVAGWLTVGDCVSSDPVRHDERAYALLHSRAGLPKRVQPLHGWYPREQAGWRWTRGEFSALLFPNGLSAPVFTLNFFVHPQSIERYGSVRLACSVDGVPVTPETYREPGMHSYRWSVPAREQCKVTFRVDGTLDPDGRELGLLVTSLDVT